MKKYSNNKQAHKLRSALVLGICVIAMAIASWGLYVTVFSPSSASGDYLMASVNVSTPVYTIQPFTISGTVFPSTGYDPEGVEVYITFEMTDSSGVVHKSMTSATIDAQNKFSTLEAEEVSFPGKYTVKLWRDVAETWTLPQIGGNATFTVTEGLPVRASIRVQVVNSAKNLYSVRGTIAKVPTGYVTPITIHFANKFCTKNPVNVSVLRVVDAKTRIISGTFLHTFTWDFKKCGGFWVKPFYQKQWLKNSKGELVQYWYPPEAPTCTPQPCAPPPSGCYYKGATDCTCGTLVCRPTSTPTQTPTRTPLGTPVDEF